MKIDIDTNKTISKQQQHILKSMLKLLLVIFVIFCIRNIFRENYLVSGTLAILIVLCTVMYVYFNKITYYKHYIKITLLFTIILDSALLLLVFSPNLPSRSFVWIFILPLTSYVFLGKRIGFYVTVIYGLLAMYQYHFSIHSAYYGESGVAVNVVACYLLIWYVSYFFELSKDIALKQLMETNTKDALTDLYNRTVIAKPFHDHQKNTLITSVLIDIDFFKKINDIYGHDAGDKALVFFAKKIQKHFKEIGYVFRMGGEEFSVVLPNISLEECEKSCNDFLQTMRDSPFMYDNNSIIITFSAGISVYPIDGSDYNEVLIKADKRMYQAKQQGRNRIISS